MKRSHSSRRSRRSSSGIWIALVVVGVACAVVPVVMNEDAGEPQVASDGISASGDLAEAADAGTASPAAEDEAGLLDSPSGAETPVAATDLSTSERDATSKKEEKFETSTMKLGRFPKYETAIAYQKIVPKVEGEIKEYDPNTRVYIDGLFFVAHAEDSPGLIMKDKKKTMTLAEADKAGAQIAGFPGYQRKHPVKIICDDAVMYGPARAGVHYFGCTYMKGVHSGMKRKTVREWRAEGTRICHRCLRRAVGPSYTLSAEEWAKVKAELKKIEEEKAQQKFVAPEGWTPEPFDPNNPPPKEDLDVLVRSKLRPRVPSNLEALYFKDRTAYHEDLMTSRLFFSVGDTYILYRGTGDKRLLDQILWGARNRQRECEEALDANRKKAASTEGAPLVFSMAAWSRITLQHAVKYPGTVSEKEIEEAEGLLKTVIKVLKPHWESTDDLNPEMGIPQKVVDDYQSRAYNRAMNGVGTIATAYAALKDLQAVKKTGAYQPTIDRYRKLVSEYMKWFKSRGYFSRMNGKNHFFYAYNSGKGEQRIVDGVKILGRPEDGGHYCYTVIGCTVIYDAARDLGVDDNLLNAMSNAHYYNSTVMLPKVGKQDAGIIQCLTAHKHGRKRLGGKTYAPGRHVLMLLHAFSDEADYVRGICTPLNEGQIDKKLRSSQVRLWGLYGSYMKALRKDPSLIHLGDKKGMSASRSAFSRAPAPTSAEPDPDLTAALQAAIIAGVDSNPVFESVLNRPGGYSFARIGVQRQVLDVVDERAGHLARP